MSSEPNSVVLLEEAITSLGKTANRIADERNQFKAERDRLRSVNGKLLEALRATTDELVEMIDEHCSDHNMDWVQPWKDLVTQARAAIKAAEEEA